MPDHGLRADEKLSPADRAVKYLLNRIQSDADLRWVCGWGTQSFALLCEAEAARTGESVDDVERRRQQITYDHRLPEVLRLRKELERLQNGAAEED